MKMKAFRRRWFILISAKSIFPTHGDEEILQETSLPPWMERDTVYYFKIKGKDEVGKPKGAIKMCQCMEIFEKDVVNLIFFFGMIFLSIIIYSKFTSALVYLTLNYNIAPPTIQSNTKEEGFTFKINVEGRIYIFMADTEYDRKHWVGALQSSMKTAKEIQKGLKGNVIK